LENIINKNNTQKIYCSEEIIIIIEKEEVGTNDRERNR